MTYHQITSAERYALQVLLGQGLTPAAAARALGRHRSTITRELARNRCPLDGYYRPSKAEARAQHRRRHSRRNARFTAAEWARVIPLLERCWSPEQVAGWLRRHGQLRISHETIYRYIWAEQRVGGMLHTYLRGARKQRRKRYRSYDRRGRVEGKRPITARPAHINARRTLGHWEMDTVLGHGTPDCLLSLVERKSGYVVLGKLPNRTTAAVNRRLTPLLAAQPCPVHTITADNGTEFHGYRAVEAATGVRVYFATPHHAWERGTNENTNGLLRQYLPKRTSMAGLTQHGCHAIARALNQRPRKRLGYRTPEECYVP